MNDAIPRIPITPFELASLAIAIAQRDRRGTKTWEDYFADAYAVHYEATKFIARKQFPAPPAPLTKPPYDDPVLKALVIGAKNAMNAILVDDGVAVAVVYNLIKAHPEIADREAMGLISEKAHTAYHQAMNGHPLHFPEGVEGKAIKLILALWDRNDRLVQTGRWNLIVERALEHHRLSQKPEPKATKKHAKLRKT